MEDIAVSVIVPIYNVERYLDRCMSSLLEQSLKNIEIILVEDGSPDNCAHLCDKYADEDNRIKVIHKKNGGLGYARNSGLEIAKGEYIAFCDSDDFVDKNMYKKLYSCVKEYELDTIISGFFQYRSNENVRKIIETDKMEIFDDRNSIKKFLLQMFGSAPSEKRDYKYEMSVWRGLYKRDIIDKHCIRFPSERELISEDIVFDFDYYNYAQRVGVVPEAYYYYCDNGDSLTHTYRIDRYEKTVVLYKYITEQMKKMHFSAEELLYADRFFMARVRVLISQIVLNSEIKNKKKIIHEICTDKTVKDIYGSYPLDKLPFRQKMFAILVKNSAVFLIELIVFANYKVLT